MLKHICNLIVDKETLWSSGVRTNLIGEQNFWALRIPAGCSWRWRKILQMRGLAQEQMESRIGDGQSINFWYDFWSEKGSLHLSAPNASIYSRIPEQTKLVAFLSDDGWKFPAIANSLLHGTRIPFVRGGPDKCLWKGSSNREYSSSRAWQLIRPRAIKVKWQELIWGKGYVPKHTSISWLAVKNKFGTQDRLAGMGLLAPSP
ncbi:hypothetical protein Droror1_Dr00004722 [Drosera rotundifolia]